VEKAVEGQIGCVSEPFGGKSEKEREKKTLKIENGGINCIKYSRGSKVRSVEIPRNRRGSANRGSISRL